MAENFQQELNSAMGIPIRSRTWPVKLDSLFRYSNDEEKQVRVQMARLAVLFEDLTLEIESALETGDTVEQTRKAVYTRMYFMRRGLATAWEMRQAIAVLNKNSAFLRLKANMKPSGRKAWDAASTFFTENHALLKAHRNDIGGHFTDSAATFVIDHLDSDSATLMEVYRNADGVLVPKFLFAADLVAIAFRMGQNDESTLEEQLLATLRPLVDALAQAIAIGTVIGFEVFVPR